MRVGKRLVFSSCCTRTPEKCASPYRKESATALFLLLTVCLWMVPNALAGFDHVYFSVNGDTLQTSMTQGDEFYWACTCDTGATINWEIWFDANSNGSIDPGTDAFLASENITDGNALTEADPILDGYAIGQPFRLSAEPGTYIFKATDFVADSSIEKSLTMVEMASPPNQISGKIILPGVTPPNSVLANHSVFAESETGAEGAFLAITDDMGAYSMNVGPDGTGVLFYLDANPVDRYVAPGYLSALAVGSVTDKDFLFESAVDSIWGFIKDDMDAIIPFEVNVRAQQYSSERGTISVGGRYAIYFSGSDNGEWSVEVDSRVCPYLLNAERISVDLDTVSGLHLDIILPRADTSLYARVTENGAPPVNNYHINAYSYTLNAWSEAVSGTGSDNVAPLGVSSMDPDDWTVYISTWDDDYPVPFGLIPRGGDASGLSPGDTADLDLVGGTLVAGTIVEDVDDNPVVWNDVWVSAGAYGTYPDGGGGFAFYADTGNYELSVFADGYIASPQSRILPLTEDTTNGLDFSLNETHHQVTGTLLNVSLPLDQSWYAVTARTGTSQYDGYYVLAQVDSATGAYQLDLCDGTWTLEPPCCLPNVNPPANAEITIGEPPDVSSTVDFQYSAIGACCGLYDPENRTGNVDQDPGNVKDLVDILMLASWAFLGGVAPPCPAEGNADGDASCMYDLSDILTMASAAFLGGNPPAYCLPECE